MYYNLTLAKKKNVVAHLREYDVIVTTPHIKVAHRASHTPRRTHTTPLRTPLYRSLAKNKARASQRAGVLESRLPPAAQ